MLKPRRMTGRTRALVDALGWCAACGGIALVALAGVAEISFQDDKLTSSGAPSSLMIMFDERLPLIGSGILEGPHRLIRRIQAVPPSRSLNWRCHGISS